jgi:hypothetical protein
MFPQSKTTANLARDGRLTLTLSLDGGMYELLLRARRLAHSTCSHLRCRISRTRQPVNSSSRIAAAAKGPILVKRFLALGRCLAFGFPHPRPKDALRLGFFVRELMEASSY